MQVSNTPTPSFQRTNNGMMSGGNDPAAATPFTAPAYSASQNTSRSGVPGGVFGAVCFAMRTFFGFHGRISRLDYWLIGSAYTFTAIAGYGIFAQSLGTWNWSHLLERAEAEGILLRFYMFSFLMIMLRLSLEARRFQDRDLSGYWYFGYLMPVLNLYLLFANSFLSGTRGGNRYDL